MVFVVLAVLYMSIYPSTQTRPKKKQTCKAIVRFFFFIISSTTFLVEPLWTPLFFFFRHFFVISSTEHYNPPPSISYGKKKNFFCVDLLLWEWGRRTNWSPPPLLCTIFFFLVDHNICGPCSKSPPKKISASFISLFLEIFPFFPNKPSGRLPLGKRAYYYRLKNIYIYVY